jgi:glutathione S-transferase
MYSMAGCPTCERARVELREQGTPYEERLVDRNAEHQREVLRLTLQRTVPVFVKDGKVVVGFHGERG